MIGSTEKSRLRAIDDAAATWVFRRSGGLDAGAEAEFRAWCEADPRHAAALARLEVTSAALDRPRLAGQSAVLAVRLGQRAVRRRRRRLAIAGAACLMLAVGLASWHTIGLGSVSPAGVESRALVLLPETRTLSDGTVVELKAGAEVTVAFEATVRRVALVRGEAHFAVAHRDVPFVVTAAGVDFRAVGTAFSVQLAEQRVELVVTDGRVAVEESRIGGGGDPVEAAAPPLTVAAGQGVAVPLRIDTGRAAVDAPVALSQGEMAERLAWRVARIEFTDTPLREAVELMNRHNRTRIEVLDPELGRIPVSGLFRSDRLEAFVRLLEVNFDVAAEEDGHTIGLRRKR